MNERFIQTQKLYQLLDLEIYICIILLGLLTYICYRFFLKDVSEERHISIRKHLKSIIKYYVAFSFSFIIYNLLFQSGFSTDTIKLLLPYIGVATYVLGVFCFVRSSRLLVLQYLFLGSMRAGVPLLLVNIFSLGLTVVIFFWTMNNIFGVQLTPLVATSAAFSIILGLALQDTLGNLIAGISLQIDKTFEIGDWLEIMNGSTKIVGQVKELSWRSTLLIGFADEMITVPNKLVSQCQVSNYSPEGTPILRSQTFKFPFNTDIQKAIVLLEKSASQIAEIRVTPAPFAFAVEATDFGVTVKLVYFLDNYGKQFSIGDKVVRNSLELLAQNQIYTAKPSIQVQSI